MAVQLERFLRRQLKKPGLPDREFIEATLAEVLSYRKQREVVTRPELITGTGVYSFFRSSKNGLFLDDEAISRARYAALDGGVKPETLETYTEHITRVIGEENLNSIGHLCLPIAYSRALWRENYRKIDDVRKLLGSGKLGSVRQVGVKGEKEILVALADFDR